MNGLIVKAQSGFFTVETERGSCVCQLRGRLKKERRKTDLAAVGDRVQISVLADGTGVIEAVEPRTRVLSRRASSGSGRAGQREAQGEKEQVILANPDQAVFVFAIADPAPHLRMLDRFIVIAEAYEIPILICVNKIDLVPEAEARATFGLYERIGYRVVFVSAAQGLGLEELRRELAGKISVLAGPSGVGKSSLLNALQPGLGLAARQVSRATTKGRHTTVAPELLKLNFGGYLADTPGMRTLGLWDIEPEELDHYFREFRPFMSRCEFSNCSHTHEPGCAVRHAVERGEISPIRHSSYLRLRLGEKGD